MFAVGHHLMRSGAICRVLMSCNVQVDDKTIVMVVDKGDSDSKAGGGKTNYETFKGSLGFPCSVVLCIGVNT